MSKILINIPEEESKELEKAFYELQADQSTIAFCMGQPTVNFDAIKQYRDIVAEEFAKVELLKRGLANKYKSDDINLTEFNYSFDFIENQIIFEKA